MTTNRLNCLTRDRRMRDLMWRTKELEDGALGETFHPRRDEID
jgi:hypothetical protein